jgi:pimeloyl-ACP methyl ester carboxylesterase
MAMTERSLVTATTQFVEHDGTRFAYRRFGEQQGRPLVFLHHFRGNLDTHDPAITDELARGREVIVFDTAGIGASSGAPKGTIDDIAKDAETFVEALGLSEVDLLGHSMGGHEAQLVAHRRPDLVRKLILVGSGPRGGEGMAVRSSYTAELFAKIYSQQDLMWVPIFFSTSDKGRGAGLAYIDRIRARKNDRDDPVSADAATSHGLAARAWGQQFDGGYGYLKEIAQPTLVVSGSNDIVVPTVNSYILQQNIPDARLIVYPDSNHGSHFEYHEHFVREATYFLDDE